MGCPPTPSVFLGSELMECNVNKDFDKIAEPICDGDFLTEGAPECSEDDIGTDYAYAKERQCGGADVAYWMTCKWEPGAWSDCNGCGDVLQKRDIECKRVDGETIDCPGYILETYGKCCFHPDFHTNCGGCDEAGMPAHQQHCVNFDACSYEWHVKTKGHHHHSNCATFSKCVSQDDWMVDDRASGSDADQKAWCTTGPDRTHKNDDFVTYGLGACWATDTKVETVADSGWSVPCPCYYGDAGNIDFGYHELGDREYTCNANKKYAQRFLLDDPGMVKSLSVDMEGVAEVKGAIYTDSGGQPDQRLYVTNGATSKTNRGWVIMHFETPGGVYLNGGFYWLTFQVKQDVTCFGVEGDKRGDFKYLYNEDAFKEGNASPADPFDPFQTIETESGGFALFASYSSTGLKTHRETKEPCDSLKTCEQCLDGIDLTDHTKCMMTNAEGCQSTKYVQERGLSSDLACQLTWGMKMYNSLENTQCNGGTIVGPTGETGTRKDTVEDCAQLCYTANAQYFEYNIGSFAAPAGSAAYCEGFQFNPNEKICRMLQNIKPSTTTGVSCYVSKELGNPCSFKPGAWVQDSDRAIYYVSGSQGQLASSADEPNCFGDAMWGGEDKPGSFACDGAVDSNCDVCIQASLDHNKMLGKMTCDKYFSQQVNICQFSEKSLVCDKGLTIRILEGSYGRFQDGGGLCTSPPVMMNTEKECGTPNSPSVLELIKTACDGKNECEVDARDGALGGDQGCGDVAKYAAVRYQCVA